MKYVFFGIVAVCFASSLVLDLFSISRKLQRRIYWSCTCVGALFAFLAGYPDLNKGYGMAGVVLSAMVFAAYAYSPYIKIGGKIYALTVADSQPDPEDAHAVNSGQSERDGVHADEEFDPAPDSYSGLLTPTTMWWAIVVIAGMSTANVCGLLFSHRAAWTAALGIGFLVFLAVATGYGDASWDYRIARGQYLPFAVASVITAGGFALVYLIAHYTGRRRPLRSKHSMEYRAHPRHHKHEQ